MKMSKIYYILMMLVAFLAPIEKFLTAVFILVIADLVTRIVGFNQREEEDNFCWLKTNRLKDIRL